MTTETERKKIALTTLHAPAKSAIDDATMRGLAVKLDMLLTHYRKPKDLNLVSLNASAKTLRRWLAKAVPTNAPPPVEFIQALEDDLNTPKAITYLHKYAGENGEFLYAGMKMLGLLPGSQFCEPHELKTLPIDQIPLPQWEWQTERVEQ